MAEARNYEEYRRQVLDELGIEYVTEDITDFRRWRKKLLTGLADIITKGDMTVPVAKWLDAHPEITTTLQDGEVTTIKIADEAIDSDKLADGSVTYAKLANGVVKDVMPDYDNGKIKVHFSNGTEVEFEVVDAAARSRLDDHDSALAIEDARIDAISEWQGGSGTIVFDLIAKTGMTSISTSQYLSRDKLNNKLYCYIMSKNETGESIVANTHLFEIPAIDLSYSSITLRGIMTAVINSDGTWEFGTGFIRKVTDGDTTSYYLTVNIAIPDGANLVMIGECSTSPTVSLLLNKGYYNQSLAEEICDNVLHGTEDYSWWRQGAFQYSNSDSVRLNPTDKKTDCTGIIYMAFQLLGIHPRGSVPKAILPDGMLISHATAGNPLDISLAKAGDIICYKRSGETSVTHCSLYAGNDTIYEMAQTYPDAGTPVINGDTYVGQPDQELYITNGYGPYIIPTPASIYRMSNYTRYLVRYL